MSVSWDFPSLRIFLKFHRRKSRVKLFYILYGKHKCVCVCVCEIYTYRQYIYTHRFGSIYIYIHTHTHTRWIYIQDIYTIYSYIHCVHCIHTQVYRRYMHIYTQGYIHTWYIHTHIVFVCECLYPLQTVIPTKLGEFILSLSFQYSWNPEFYHL